MKLCIKNGSVTLNGNTILESINFEVNDGDKIAVVGKNGTGKTTLLKAIIDNELLDEGIDDEKFNIIKIGSFNMGYLSQIHFDDENITLLDAVLESFKEIIELENSINSLVVKMNENNSSELIAKYTSSLDRFKLLGGYSYKKEYEIMLKKFGFTDEDKEKLICSFSGGQKTKISFIKLLLSKPDLLILDEPTNHLDIEAIEWLEGYLKSYKGAVIVVSHDRMFLDNIVNVVYDIDYGRVVKYVGNYSKYEVLKKESYEKLLSDYETQQKEIKRLMAIYERFRSKPTKASMALSKLHQVEKMDIIDKPNRIDAITFKTNLSKMEESVKDVLKASELVIGYDRPLAKLDLDIKRGKKIGVIGKNGIGKSTLLKTLNGIIEPLSGTLSYGLHVTPGYFDQNLAMIDSSSTVLEEFLHFLPELEVGEARSALGSFLFKGDDVYKKVSVLSGGEKVRLELCKILYNKPNFLIMDEPTNHMDIAGKVHLEEIFEQYKGTMIFVSHDRYFVRKIADQLLVFDDDGVKFYPYGYDQYMEENKRVVVESIKKTDSKKKNAILEVVQERNNRYELQKELNRLENEIIKIETKIGELNNELFNENVFNDFNKSNSINEKVMALQEELVEKNQKWEEITDKLV